MAASSEHQQEEEKNIYQDTKARHLLKQNLQLLKRMKMRSRSITRRKARTSRLWYWYQNLQLLKRMKLGSTTRGRTVSSASPETESAALEEDEDEEQIYNKEQG